MTLTAQPTLELSARPTVGSRVVLRAQGLRKSFGGHRVLDDVDLVLHEGEVVLLRGENGSGKTTLLNILTGNLEPDSGTIEYLADGSPRTCRFPRSWIGNLNPFDHFTPEFVAREGLGRTWQDVRLFGSQTLRDNIAVADSRNAGENPLIALFTPGCATRREAEICQQADNMLAQLGLAGREDSSGDMISLGQSKRVAIARAVAGGARILFLDEPLAGLDRQGITDILQLLQTLVQEHRLTLVIVEHVFNFAHLHHLVNVHWGISEGRIERDTATPIAQVDSIDGIPVVTRPHWFHLFAQGADSISSVILPLGATIMRFHTKGYSDSKTVFEAKNLVVRRGRRAVVGADAQGNETGFNFTLHHGEIAVLQAPNGWGKSTLFEALSGIHECVSGSIQLNGNDVTCLPAWQRPQRGIHFNAAGTKYFGQLTLQDLYNLSGHHLNGDAPAEPHRTLDSLSGGQLRRAALATFLKRPNLLLALLDEPFLALDQNSSERVAKQIMNLKNGAVFIAEPSKI